MIKGKVAGKNSKRSAGKTGGLHTVTFRVDEGTKMQLEAYKMLQGHSSLSHTIREMVEENVRLIPLIERKFTEMETKTIESNNQQNELLAAVLESNQALENKVSALLNELEVEDGSGDTYSGTTGEVTNVSGRSVWSGQHAGKG